MGPYRLGFFGLIIGGHIRSDLFVFSVNLGILLMFEFVTCLVSPLLPLGCIGNVAFHRFRILGRLCGSFTVLG